MKALITAFVLFWIMGTTFHVKQDPFSPGRYSIYDRDWRRSGYIIADDLRPGVFRMYDKDWKRKGNLELNIDDFGGKGVIRVR